MNVYMDERLKSCTVCVQVYGENTLIFPLLVAETFARVYKDPPSLREQSEQVAAADSETDTKR